MGAMKIIRHTTFKVQLLSPDTDSRKHLSVESGDLRRIGILTSRSEIRITIVPSTPEGNYFKCKDSLSHL